MKKEIKSQNAPAAIGPYSQAIQAEGKTIYISGQLPVNPKTGEFSGDTITSQTLQSLNNIKAILEEAGADMNNIVKTTVLLKDIKYFTHMNEVYQEFFNPPYPARAAYQIGALPKDALVEIEAVAVIPEK
ncbi:MAG: RidA family protein [Spirochaetales bacterium]|nr:RidA family protein [Spirochaetales bacterium]